MSSMAELTSLGIEAHELDVTDEDSIIRVKSALFDALGGKLDILVNNAYVYFLSKGLFCLTTFQGYM